MLRHTYDSLYRLTGETVTGGLNYTKAWTYDAVGNRLTQATTGLGAGTVTSSYDDRDRLLTETLGANPPTAYTYDASGNLLTKDGEATYTWDFENRLVRVTKIDGTLVDHAYDADGNRVQTKVTPPTGPPTTTNFLVDTSGALSHVVTETDDTGALKAHYVRGDDLLAVLRPDATAPSGLQSRFYHADHIGSVRRLTDETGNITDGYSYSAFGELLAHTGTDPQPYAFAGEPHDPNSGFQYHRARWMDSRTGRFLGMDPFRGSDDDPVSLHRYQYAAADPVNMVDPTGKFLATALTVVGIVAVLAGISSIACAPLRRRKTAGLQWTANLPSDEAQTIRSNAIAVAKSGIEQLGILVTESAQADYRLQVVSSPGGNRAPGDLGVAFIPQGRAEIFYFRTRTAVLNASRDNPSIASGLSLAESLGNALGFIAVHEFGHLVVPDADYHNPSDPSTYNTTGLDSASTAIMTVSLLNGLGYWTPEMKARLMGNLGTR